MEESEIFKSLHDDGYSFVKSEKLNPSYYKIKQDGTVIRCLIKLIAIHVSSTGISNAVTINEVTALVPQQNKKPKLIDPNNIEQLSLENIEDGDLDYETLREEFSVYDLENGQTIRIKTVVGQIIKYKSRTVMGDPIYNVIPTPIVRVKQDSNLKLQSNV